MSLYNVSVIGLGYCEDSRCFNRGLEVMADIYVAKPGFEPRTRCNASKKLKHSTTASSFQSRQSGRISIM